MFDGDTSVAVAWLWAVFGTAAGAIFYSRFYLQWLVSEIKRRSVVPEFFWYQSTIGSIMLLVWAFHVQSPLGALGQSLNVVPYTRNLVHIWREKGRLTHTLNWIATTLAILIAAGAVVIVAVVWWREYHVNAEASATTARTNWFWLGVGVVGQFLFGCRLLVQWAVTEWHQRSVVPAIFWQLSFWASILQIASFAQRQEWVYCIGTAANLFIYARNLWFIHRGRTEAIITEKAK